MSEKDLLLSVKNLSKWFPRKYSLSDAIQRKPREYVKALTEVSFDIHRGEHLGLVGESGCGKSTLALSIMRLYEPHEGQILLDGEDITHLKGKELRKIRPKMQMVFQDPYSSLDPRMTVYEILAEILKVHHVVPKEDIPKQVEHLMHTTGLRNDLADRYPGEFSGGQRQRIGIARAIAVNPAFIVADEPVSALDVSIQAQILNLLEQLQQELNLTMLFISHDLHVVRHVTERVIVMYLGRIVESGSTQAVFDSPYHPYTKVLTKAIPEMDPRRRSRESAIEGEPPSPINMPVGCAFHPRCRHCGELCTKETPVLISMPDGRQVACHYPLNESTHQI